MKLVTKIAAVCAALVVLLSGCMADEEALWLPDDLADGSDTGSVTKNDTAGTVSDTASDYAGGADTASVPDNTEVPDTNSDTAMQPDSGSGETFIKGQGTWVDPATYLIWEEPQGNKGAGGMGPTHAAAQTYCDNLKLAGVSDWRLPTINELRTLVRGVSTTMTAGKCPTTDSCSNQDECNKDKDNTKGFGNACLGCQALDPKYDAALAYLTAADCQLSTRQLDNTECYRVPALTGPCSGDWSSTPNTSTTGTTTKAFWYLNFQRGLINSDADMLSGANWVRCVRTGSAADLPENQPEYPVVNQGECIRDRDCAAGTYCLQNKCMPIPEETWADTVSGLVWQTLVPETKTWADAKTYCEGLTLGGKDDWRLPSITELKTLSSCAETAKCGVSDTCSGYTSCGGSICKKGCASGNYLPEILGLNIYSHWSVTEEEQTAAENAWTITFSTGGIEYLDKGWKFTVRCVR